MYGRDNSPGAGRPVSRERVDEITAIAERHGFHLSGFRSFEREVKPQQIEVVRRNAQVAKSAHIRARRA